MWLIGVTAFIAVMIGVMIIALHVQAKNAQDSAKDSTPRMIYTVRHTPDYSGPSLYERSKGGQRPFGDDSMTRRSERARRH